MNDSPLTLRKALPADEGTLKNWSTQAHVRVAIGEESWDWENELNIDYPWRQMLIAELDARPIGFVQIIDPHMEVTGYWGDIGPYKRALDMWIGEKEF
ncbi:MAG: GNAT family N-acetyltransferase, partial [Flavobacteriales bacterium]|nr:GNAT family N-acetyltransferase [Flavobacteriales bacterium]